MCECLTAGVLRTDLIHLRDQMERAEGATR